jgi:hypothetical protein
MSEKIPVLTKKEIATAYTLRHKAARYREFKLDLTDLLRHRSHGCPFHCHISCAFEAFRWMHGLADRWHKPANRIHPIRLAMDHERGTIGSYGELAFTSDWDRDRFGMPGLFDLLLLAEESGQVEAWRKLHKLRAYQTHTIPAPATASMRNGYWDGFCDSIQTLRTLNTLLTFSGKFTFSPNEYHPKARHAYSVRLHLATYPEPVWQVHAHYSYPKDTSSWFVLAAEQKPTEPFHWFIERALKQLQTMCGVDAGNGGGR